MEKDETLNGKVTIIISTAGNKAIASPPQGQLPRLRVVRPKVFGEYRPPKEVKAIKTPKQ